MHRYDYFIEAFNLILRTYLPGAPPGIFPLLGDILVTVIQIRNFRLPPIFCQISITISMNYVILSGFGIEMTP
jgi:hypothetical protein